MKKLLAASLCLLLLLSGCMGGEKQTEPTPQPTAEPTTLSIAAPTPLSTFHSPLSTATPLPTAMPGLLAGRHIGIDPGHQSEPNRVEEPIAPDSEIMRNKASSGTAGASTGVREHELVLEVGLRLAELLRASDAEVMLTRQIAEVNLSGSLRAQMLGEAQVDLALTLHCAGADDTNARGAYAMVATRGSTGWHEESATAARAILAGYAAETGLPVFSRGVLQSADQTILNWCERPIVWMELGHLSNAEDEAFLADPDSVPRIAYALYLGIVAYFQSLRVG